MFKGLVFYTASLTTTAADPDAVWLEGTAHTAAALIARILRGGDSIPLLLQDVSQTVELLQDCMHAQRLLGAGQTVGGKAIAVGYGVVAATSVLDTGFGYTYGPSLHIGATGWFLIAGYAGNPVQLRYRVLGKCRRLRPQMQALVSLSFLNSFLSSWRHNNVDRLRRRGVLFGNRAACIA